MAMSAALVSDFKLLTRALGRPSTDLLIPLRRLARHIVLAVPSYLGLRMAVVIDDYPFTLLAMDRTPRHGGGPDDVGDDIAATAQLPLRALSRAAPVGELIFYAARAGAFDVFAADLVFALGLDLAAVVLDEQRPAGSFTAESNGLFDSTSGSRAECVPIEQGIRIRQRTAN